MDETPVRDVGDDIAYLGPTKVAEGHVVDGIGICTLCGACLCCTSGINEMAKKCRGFGA